MKQSLRFLSHECKHNVLRKRAQKILLQYSPAGLCTRKGYQQILL